MAKRKKEKKQRETVNHPNHYGGDTVYEVIKVLEAWGLDFDFDLGNAVKYIARAGKKDYAARVEDLKKALWYLNRRIQRMELADAVIKKELGRRVSQGGCQK